MGRSSSARRGRRVQRDQNVRTFATDEALQEAWRSYKSTEAEALRNQLVEHYLYLVRFMAERIGAKLPDEVDVEDLMSAGTFGLVDAIKAFDLERGVKFETFCAQRIRGAIYDELRSLDWVPRLVRQRAHKLDEIRRALQVEFGRAPTEREIQDRLGLPDAQFEKIVRDSNATSLVSLSQKFSDQDDEREVGEIDVLPDEQSADPVFEAQKLDLRDYIKQKMSRAERLILVLYYYEGMTMKEIGATLDLSESRVSQMHSAIIEQLREQFGATAQEISESMDIIA